MQYIDHYDSPLGNITLAECNNRLCGLWFEGRKHFGCGLEKDYEIKDLPVFVQTKQWLDIYFQGSEPSFIPELYLRGKPFQEEVWAILRTIPFGKTTTYGEIASLIAEKRGLGYMSAQAVGNAVGRNPVSIIVGCHRVIGKDGSLTGYAGGMERKIWLLKNEGIKVKEQY